MQYKTGETPQVGDLVFGMGAVIRRPITGVLVRLFHRTDKSPYDFDVAYHAVCAPTQIDREKKSFLERQFTIMLAFVRGSLTKDREKWTSTPVVSHMEVARAEDFSLLSPGQIGDLEVYIQNRAKLDPTDPYLVSSQEVSRGAV